MADERDDEKFDNTEAREKQSTGGQQSHQSEYGQQADQTSGTEGQPIGGNDNETGSGTPLSEGGERPNAEGEGFILRGGGAEEEEDEEGAGPRDVGSGGPGSSV